MKPIDPKPLRNALAQLLDEIDRHSDPSASNGLEGKARLEPLEKLARAVTVQLKALCEVEAYNEKASRDQQRRNYLNYADLPPPSPEDRAHIIRRLQLLYDRVNAAREIPPSPSDNPGSSGELPS